MEVTPGLSLKRSGMKVKAGLVEPVLSEALGREK